MASPKLRWLWVALAILGLRLPFVAFQLGAGSLRGLSLSQNEFELLCQWDCRIFAALGKQYLPESSAFFPLHPLLIRGVRELFTGLSPQAAALAVSGLFTWIAGFLTLGASAKLWTESQRKWLGFPEEGWLLLALLSLYPHGHFWLQGYSEPVFASGFGALLVSIGTGNLWLGGLWAGILAVTRPQGIWIAGIFVLLALAVRKRQSWGPILLAAIPFALFLAWLAVVGGDPLLFYRQQSGWGRKFDLVQGLWELRPRWDRSTLFLYLSWAASWHLWKTRSPLHRFLSMSTLALGTLPVFVGGFYSYVRFVSVNLGLFVAISDWLSRRPNLRTIVLVVFTALLGVQVYAYSFGKWAG